MTLPDNIENMTKEEFFQELVKACKLYDDTMVEYHAILKDRKALREVYQQELVTRQAKLGKLKAEQDRILAEKEAEYNRIIAEKQAEYERLITEKEDEYERLP